MNDWGKRICRNFQDQIDACRRDLEATHVSIDDQDSGSYLELKNKLGSLISQE